MPTARGFATRLGLRREALVGTPTWPGTAIAASGLLPFLACAVEDTPVLDVLPADRASGVSPGGVVLRSHRVGGTLTVPLAYEGLEGLWCAALGLQAPTLDDVAQPEEIEAGAYRHLFELDPGPLSDRPWLCGEGWVCGQGLACGQQLVRRQTLAADKQVAVWEHRSCLVQGWTLTLSPQGCTLAVTLLGYDQVLDSTVNTAGSLAALADQTREPVLPVEATLRLGPYSTSTALSSAHNLACASFSLTVEQTLDAAPSQRTGLYVEAPHRTGPARVTARIALPRHTATTHLTRLLGETDCMLTLTCAGPTIPGTSTAYALAVYVPSVRVGSDPLPISGPGLVPETLELVALRPAAAAAGMPVSQYLSAVLVEVVSSVDTHTMES